MIVAFILAAGKSKRSKIPKVLLPFRGETIIEIVINNILQSKVDKTIVVLGAHHSEIEDKINKFPVEIVMNPDFRKGMLTSVHIGFQALPTNTQAALVVRGDQPGIPSGVINEIIKVYKKTKKGIVLPVFNKERGHPVLIDLKYKQEIQKLGHDVGLRGTVYSHPDDTMEIDVQSEDILHDIYNRGDDYKIDLNSKG